MNKLEFSLLAIGNLVEEKDKKLSKQLIQLANEAHYYYPEHERSLLWNDLDLAIDWQTTVGPTLSKKDLAASSFISCDKYE